jgi:hypothetical protein
MRKTSKTGAYARSKKKAMSIRRNPIVEQKTRTSEEIFVRQKAMATTQTWVKQTVMNYTPTNDDNAYTPLQLTPYTHMSQGLEEDSMVGRSVYAKYMHIKVHFTFPKGDDIPVLPYECWLVHGWLKRSPNWTGKTTPPVQLGDFYRFEEWTNMQLEDYFNERVDKLRFIPKRSSNFKILRKQKIVPNLTRQTGAVPGSLATVSGTVYQTGMVPDVSARCSWNIQRKIHYEKGIRQWNTDPDGGDTPGPTPGTPPAQPGALANLPDYFYPNSDMWVPFAIIYQPNFANMTGHGAPDQPDDKKVAYRANSIMYYTDS